MGDNNEIVVGREGAVDVITLNRPDVFNALSPSMISDLDTVFRDLAADRSCRAIVLTGVGRGFCAGIDVKSVAKRDAEAATGEGRADQIDPVLAGFENLHLRLNAVIRTIHSLPVPVISAVNGHAIGAGFAFAAASDLRVGSNSATFANGFVKRGISGCEMGTSYFLPKIVGASVAFDLMMTGRRVGADEALRLGLISQLVDDDQLLETAVALGASIAENAPTAISMTKEVMWENVHAVSLDQALALESRTQALVRTTADAHEARQSFLEKRSPSFSTGGSKRPLR